MIKDDLRTFMCDGMASAISGDSSQAFWDGLDALRTTWLMTKDDLVTFMCNSVASAMTGDASYVVASGHRAKIYTLAQAGGSVSNV